MFVANRIQNDQAYKATYPDMKGKGSPATHELHVFLGELNPSEERVQEYYKVVDAWNQAHPNLTDKMKACYLALVFRDPQGNENTVKVMQSARYIRTDSTDQAVKEIHADADYFAGQGFHVIREKIEATAYGILGIPQNDEDAKTHAKKYFEFHIKVAPQDQEENHPITDAEVNKLRHVSKVFRETFKTPVPLSYNCNRDKVGGDGQGYQRFLNVRFQGLGIKTIEPKLQILKEAINATGFKVIKMISEYVWYDSFRQLDAGWIDFKSEEKI